jgi:hypothetical protein
VREALCKSARLLDKADVKAHCRRTFGARYSRSVMADHRRRLYETGAWLVVSGFPLAYPVHISHHIYRIHYGMAWREGKAFYIRINSRMTLREKLYTLLHEWSHCRTWRHEDLERRDVRPMHPDEFYLELGRIERLWTGEVKR